SEQHDHAAPTALHINPYPTHFNPLDRPYGCPAAAFITGQPWRPQGPFEIWSRMRVAMQPGKQQMVLPEPVDAQILAGKSLATESGLLQKPDRGDVGRNAGRLDAMQPQRAECEGQDGRDRRRHVPLPRIGRPHPVAEAARLRATAANIGEREATNEAVVALAEDKERVGEVAALVLGVTLNAATERGA